MAREKNGSAIRAVLFDLGGTLVSTRQAQRAASAALSLGLDLDPEAIHHSLREVEKEFDDGWGVLDLPTFWQQVLSRALGSPVDLDRARAILERVNRLRVPSELYSDVGRCLDQLDDGAYRLGVISNGQSESYTRSILREVGILDRFRIVVTSGTEGVAKPDAEIFRRGVARIGVDARECVYVGNLANVDARAATRAGLHGVWLNREGVGLGSDPPEISSLTELPFWVRERAVELVK